MTSPSRYQTASDVSLVIDGPSTPTKHRNFQLSVSGLRRLEKTLVSDPDHAKLAGCAAVVIGTVLEKFVGVDNLPALVGVLHASDGVATNPIHIDELCKGLLIRTDYSGEALPASQGGPLRIIFPKGIAVQSSVCGTPKPINLKDVVKISLSHAYTIEDVELEKSLRASSARIRKHMNDDHADSCKAYAAAHGAGGLLPDEIDSAVMIGLDSRGFTLRVSASKLSSPLEVLIPYPRKLEKAAEVRKLAVEMHMTAYNTLGVGYKIRHNFYGNAAKQAWTHMPAKVKYPMAVVLVGVLAASVKLSVVGVKMLRRWR